MPSFDDLLNIAKQLPNHPGVYLMKDQQSKVLYVGKAVSLKNRVSQYFQRSTQHSEKNNLMIKSVHHIDVIVCESEVEALLKEARLIKDLQPPFNVMLKDGKSFPYIEITGDDDFPLVRVSRDHHVKSSQYFGPFTAAGLLKPALNLLQKIFKFRTCELEINEDDLKKKNYKACLLYHIDRCSAPCVGRIAKESYKDDILSLKNIILGQGKKVKKDLEHKMNQASVDLDYESAAIYRDRLKALDHLKNSGPLGSQPELEIAPVNAVEGMQELKELLHLDYVPRSIEGFDIAHLQGNQTVASLVSFIDGKPFKEGYRQFKIKTPTGGDDFLAMKEVVTRRYSRLKEEGEPFPHLVLIDGGKGQLSVAKKVFEELDRNDQCVLSLAKKEEKIYIPERQNAIRLSRHQTALRVLQHVRDEAHRFAQRYHHLLRDKKMLEQ